MDDEIDEKVYKPAACYCQVEGGSPYCSLYCEEAEEAEVIGGPCVCGRIQNVSLNHLRGH